MTSGGLWHDYFSLSRSPNEDLNLSGRFFARVLSRKEARVSEQRPLLSTSASSFSNSSNSSGDLFHFL